MHKHEWRPLKTELEQEDGHMHLLPQLPEDWKAKWYSMAAISSTGEAHVHEVPTDRDLKWGPHTTGLDEPSGQSR